MREVNICGNTVRLRGSSLSLLYYRQEFNRDLLGDLAGMLTGMVGIEALQSSSVDMSKLNFAAIDTVAILRLTWTLARTDVGPTGQFPSFMAWVQEHEDIDLIDPDLLKAVFDEATKCFFRRKPSVAQAAK